MKIVLLQDVPKVGKKYEVKEVANGLARNFLIPRKLAESAHPAALKRVEIVKKKIEQDTEVKKQQFKHIAEKIKDAAIAVKAPANEQGSLFAALTADDIAKALQEQCEISVPSEWIAIESPIKKIGEHTITIGEGEERVELKILVH